MTHIFRILVILLIFLTSASIQIYAQDNDLVEVTGRIVVENTPEPIPGAVIMVSGTDRGVLSNKSGMFTLVMKRGEVAEIEALGFKPYSFKLPSDYSDKYYTLTVSLTIDTIHLENFTFKLMSPEEFDFAFKYRYIPDEALQASRKNMSPSAMYGALAFMPRDAAEMQAVQQRQNYLRYGTQYGQPINTELGNPRAWKEFIQAWKRGDFKGKGR